MSPNILQLQREAESMPDERLIAEASNPSMMSLLAALELQDREQARAADRNASMPPFTNTVVDKVIERAMSGIGSIPQQLSPEQEMFARQAMMDMSPEQVMQQQMMMQSPMPQPMADGGLVGYQHGGYHDPDDPDNETPYEKAMRMRRLRSERGEELFKTGLGLGATGLGLGARFARDILTEEPGEYPLQSPSFLEPSPYTDGSATEDAPTTGSISDLTRQLLAAGDISEVPAIDSVTESEGEGIASLIASMQAPAVQRQELDLSQYFQMTPEEQALLDRARADAQSLESRIDTESDRLSAQANILSNVARAMARGQVPTAGEPLRELQAAQRSRREGIMDESKAMEMSALAQEAGLSRAEQEALRDRAMVEDERDYQEDLSEKERQRFNQYVAMSQSDNPDVKALGSYYLQGVGVSAAGMLTENAAADLRIRALNQINDFAESGSTDDIEASLNNLYARLQVIYGAQPVPVNVLDLARSAVRQQDPEKFAEYEASRPALGS